MDSYSPERRISFERRFLNKKRAALTATVLAVAVLFAVLTRLRRA